MNQETRFALTAEGEMLMRTARDVRAQLEDAATDAVDDALSALRTRDFIDVSEYTERELDNIAARARLFTKALRKANARILEETK